jgi:hypothetical protein
LGRVLFLAYWSNNLIYSSGNVLEFVSSLVSDKAVPLSQIVLKIKFKANTNSALNRVSTVGRDMAAGDVRAVETSG